MGNVFSFEGRSNRVEYWVSQLVFTLVWFVLAYGISEESDLLMVIGGIGTLVAFIPAVAIQVKRFHGINKTGWMILINLIPYVGGIITLVMLGFFGPVNTIDDSNDYGQDPRISE